MILFKVVRVFVYSISIEFSIIRKLHQGPGMVLAFGLFKILDLGLGMVIGYFFAFLGSVMQSFKMLGAQPLVV